jgi:hypothetical protein
VRELTSCDAVQIRRLIRRCPPAEPAPTDERRRERLGNEIQRDLGVKRTTGEEAQQALGARRPQLLEGRWPQPLLHTSTVPLRAIL